jgi:adenylate kinase family enzyme
MRLIMLSPPGAGEGAHASQLLQGTGVAYTSSGALPRAEIARGGDLGRCFAQYTSRGDVTVFEGQRRSSRAMKRGSSARRVDGGLEAAGCA